MASPTCPDCARLRAELAAITGAAINAIATIGILRPTVEAGRTGYREAGELTRVAEALRAAVMGGRNAD